MRVGRSAETDSIGYISLHKKVLIKSATPITIGNKKLDKLIFVYRTKYLAKYFEL